MTFTHIIIGLIIAIPLFIISTSLIAKKIENTTKKTLSLFDNWLKDNKDKYLNFPPLYPTSNPSEEEKIDFTYYLYVAATALTNLTKISRKDPTRNSYAALFATAFSDAFQHGIPQLADKIDAEKITKLFTIYSPLEDDFLPSSKVLDLGNSFIFETAFSRYESTQPREKKCIPTPPDDSQIPYFLKKIFENPSLIEKLKATPEETLMTRANWALEFEDFGSALTLIGEQSVVLKKIVHKKKCEMEILLILQNTLRRAVKNERSEEAINLQQAIDSNNEDVKQQYLNAIEVFAGAYQTSHDTLELLNESEKHKFLELLLPIAEGKED